MLKAIVLAAGKGTRLHSDTSKLPKVLHQAGGHTLLDWVLKHIDFIAPQDITIVVGYEGNQVKASAGAQYRYAEQTEQLGTGHAVQMAMPLLADYDGPVLICYGDMPLIKRETYLHLCNQHQKQGDDCTMLAYVSDKDLQYGRIIRDEDGRFDQVIEDRDCTPEQKKITELNAGVYVFNAQRLREGLKMLKNDNAQSEYYLTDIPAWLKAQGGRIGVVQTTGEYEGLGVNTKADLAFVDEILR